ncbi:MAG: beta-phosphoglucomutase [Bacteroidetes bacterium]|nr:beta-phosphoglucomutase [Bacteroidota bacterium]MBM3424534.1 beta-phosphoglucomutase [Bacteroidota bacterium]
MNDKTKGLIFDLDGVLVTTEYNHFVSWKKIAKAIDVSFNEHDNEQLKGISRADSLKKILELGNKAISEELFEELLAQKNEFYLNSIKKINRSNLLPGVIELLQSAAQMGLKCAVGSSSRNARFIVTKLELDFYFSTIVDGNDVTFPKPSPEVFLKGAQRMNCQPNECLVFEDALSGVAAARAGGFMSIGVGNPLLKNVADVYIDSLTEFRLEAYA